ncbi:MAG: ATP-binding cassette domain-containing protein [Tissierellia bacterium]|nr:ATP-binding cassette domain-containing protein [Tissierellia bacterium]
MLEIRNLSKTFYPKTPEENRIFKDFNLIIEKNRCTTILGPNGCGKSTLFNMISGQIKNESGEIFINGKEITNLKEEQRANCIAKVNQDPTVGVCPSLNIEENMSIALKKGEKYTFKRLIKKSNEEYIKQKLKEVDLGLENKLKTKVKFLSGGQRQCLSLIMATLKKPDLLLLDEHTAALDPKTGRIVMDKTLELIQKEKITTLMITHNLRNAIDYSDRIIMLNHGKIVLDVKKGEITERELQDIYQKREDKEIYRVS